MHNCHTHSHAWVHNLSLIQAHIQCTPVWSPHTPICTVVTYTTTHYAWGFPSQPHIHECTTVWEKPTHNVWETEFYPRTHARVFPLFPCTSGNLPLKTPVQPSVQFLPTIHPIQKIQDDKVTNLSLATPGSVAPCSHNLQITSQLSRQINNSVRCK
jgi:hypothetical protein